MTATELDIRAFALRAAIAASIEWNNAVLAEQRRPAREADFVRVRRLYWRMLLAEDLSYLSTYGLLQAEACNARR